MTTKQELDFIWQDAVNFHGHQCGGLALGVRAALEARKRFRIIKADDKGIMCVTENLSCGVDGVQAVLGCTLGKGNLKIHDAGKFAFDFFNKNTGEYFRLLARERKADMHGTEYIDFVLNAPLEDVFYCSEPRISIPERNPRSISVRCSICGEEILEIKGTGSGQGYICIDCC